LSGEEGDDTLVGGLGDDGMQGGEGDDIFVFRPGFGQDDIYDFVAGAATEDVIEFSVDMFSDVQSVLSSATQIGSDTVIGYGTDRLTLYDVTLTNLHGDDFLFAA
jgi:Ca2+-binding RTX toxin-like protein